MRSRVRRDLKRDKLDRDKVIAAMVRLIDQGFFRIGNEKIVPGKVIRSGYTPRVYDYRNLYGNQYAQGGTQPIIEIDGHLQFGLPGQPLFVFIHGGYWQRNDKETFSFVAEGPGAIGINVAVPGYTLAPEATLADIVAPGVVGVRGVGGANPTRRTRAKGGRLPPACGLGTGALERRPALTA